MRKPLSNMTAQEFVEYIGALGLNYTRAAPLLRKSQPTISLYATGRQAIPQEVAERIAELIDAQVKALTAAGVKLSATNVVGSLIMHHNQVKLDTKRIEPHPTAGRFMRRQPKDKPDTRVYPAYRMSRERYAIYVRALANWRDRVRELALQHTDAARQRDYQLELADIHVLADTAPRSVPYDVLIEHSQWDVVSRALRHLGRTDPSFYLPTEALRQHWSKHKGAGYPRHRQLPVS